MSQRILIPALLLCLAVTVPAQETRRSAVTTPGFDVKAMDRSVDPCSNFYQYACGGWLKQNPIPADQSRWGRFDELAERNLVVLRGILEKAAAPDPKRSAVEQKIGDYYASCMDEKAIDAKGLQAIRPDLDRIQAIRTREDLVAELTRLHRSGTDVMFRAGSTQDLKNAQEVIAEIDQAGLGLPDRDYYLKDDGKNVEIRKQYVAHVAKMLELGGAGAQQAAEQAAVVMRLETALAKASLDRVSRREPSNVYHRMPIAELQKLMPAIEWNRYFTALGAPAITSLNVTHPPFFTELNRLIGAEPMDTWKTYFTWHVLHEAAPLLPAAFLNENFAFYGKILTGAQELRPRWKRCVEFTDSQLGEALGQRYVDQTFGVEGKQRTLQMVQALEHALGEDIRQLDWMSPATKDQALTKLAAIANKIGYPEKWRDYTAFKVVRGDAIGNAERGSIFELHRQLSKIGKPVDPKEWLMTPPTVNAYYDPQMNNINFPAGILQPPFFDKSLDDAVNYGAIGAVIGHELTHGFDDEGRQFDARGNLRDWWTAADGKAFEQRTDCLVKEYGAYQPVPGVNLNGKLTLGENTADNGGLRVAYMALMESLKKRTSPVPKIDGLTPEQRFFLGWGQIWCQNETEEISRLRAVTDPHSPGRERVNGVLQNMPEFQKAFSCKVGSPMVSAQACRVW